MLSSKAKRELKIDQRQVLIESIEIGIASPQQIYLRGSRQLPNGKTVGLIKNSKTVNYKKFTPFRDGLFCERIFGPVTSLVCACGKKQPHSKITFCEKCEVEYIDQRSRRYRLGYISLLSPVTHIWYLKGRPSYLSLFLGKRKKTVVSLAYCNGYLIDHIPLKKKDEYQNKSKMLLKTAAMTFGQEQQKGLSVSHLSKIDNLLNNNLYKSKPFIKNVVQKRFDQPLTLASPKAIKSKICKPKAIKSSCKASLCTCKPCVDLRSFPLPPFLPPFQEGTGMGIAEGQRMALKYKSSYVDRRSSSFCKAKLIAIPMPLKGAIGGMGKGRTNFRFDRHALTSGHSHAPFRGQRVARRRKRTFTCKKNYMSKAIKPMRLPLAKANARPQSRHSFAKDNNFRPAYTNQSKHSLTCKCKAKLIAFGKRKKICTYQRYQGFISGYNRISSKSKSSICAAWSRPKVPDRFVASAVRKSIKKAQNPLKVNRFLSKNRTALNKIAFYRGTAYGKYFYTRQQCLPFLPSLVSHFYLRDALLNFMYSSPISEDIPILEYCNTKRIEPLQDVHKFMARQTVDKFKNVDLRAKNINSSFTASLPKVLRKQQSLAKLSFAERGGEPHASFCRQVHVKSTSPLVAADNTLTTPVFISVQTKIANLPKTSLSAFRLKMLYQSKKHVYLNSFFKKINKQSAPNSTSALITKNINEETDNTTLSNLELTAIREILSYTGGGAIQQLLKQFDPHDLCKFLVAERQILRALYQKHIDVTRNDVKISDDCLKQMQDLRSSSALNNVSNVSEYQNNLSIIEKSFFSTAVQFLQGDIKDNGFLQDCTLPAPLVKSFVSSPSVYKSPYKSKRSTGICKPTQIVAKSDSKNLPSKPPLNGLSLKEKRPFWGLQNKKTQLYQKKEIMRISRRIYKIARRLKVAQLLTLNHRRPEWMILSHLPVLPPDLRPILQMSEKVIVASDLNIMYQRVIYRNNRHLRVRFIDFQLVTAIQRLVQDAVDRLMENGKGGSKPYYTQGGRPLKSLSDILKGKKGRFRLNLLGKRVDFSGRSVIVVAPSLKIHECGLPKDIALELYHYFLLRQLIVKKYCASIVTAKKMIKSKSPEMWDVLREVMYHHPVLLNRAPTLHRLGIQAFQPKLVVGNAIWLHPLVCSGFNADFDGDQMGVHLPLSFAARAESWDLLWSRNNLLSPATGQPMLVPSQDMVLGFYYMTALPMPLGRTSDRASLKGGQEVGNKGQEGGKGTGQGRVLANSFDHTKTAITPYKKDVNKSIVFLNSKSIITNYQNGILKLHTPVWLHWGGKIENENNSATPFELRISGFGSQQYVYENYISNNLFSGHTSRLIDKSSVSLGQSQALLALICKPCPLNKAYKSSLQKQAFSVSKHVDRSPSSSYKSPSGSLARKAWQSASLCVTQSKASYIRTTAGRVLMNNILKGDA